MGERSENQYLLALAISIRARKLRSGAPALVDNENSKRKSIQTAMEEVAKRKILFSINEE